MGVTAAKLFDSDRAQTQPITDTFLPGVFAGAHDHESTATHTPIIISQAQSDADSDAADSLMANPWVQTLKQRVLAKIENKGWGEGIDLLIKNLDGREFEQAEKILKEFQYEFAEAGYHEAANYIGDLLSYSDLGLGFDFFNTSENSGGGVPEPDADINRYRIESHFADERLKPRQHVQPFLGISYG